MPKPVTITRQFLRLHAAMKYRTMNVVRRNDAQLKNQSLATKKMSLVIALPPVRNSIWRRQYLLKHPP